MLSNTCDPQQMSQSCQQTSTETINHDKISKDREQIIKNYLESEIPNAKSYFCRFFKRGRCHFSAKECKFAHSAEDFVWNKSIHMDQKPLTTGTQGKNKKAPKGEEKKNTVDEEEEKSIVTQSLEHRPEQKSLGLEKNFLVVYNYQLRQKEKGKIERAYTREEIDADGPIFAALRRSMLKEVIVGFYDILFKEHHTKVLKTSVVEAFFTSIGWTNLLPEVTDNLYAFEVSRTWGTFIVKLPKLSELIEMFEDHIISLLKNFKLYESLPISPSVLRKYYYKEIIGEKAFEPNLFVLQKNTNQTFDEFLQQLQQSERFKTKLVAAIGEDFAKREDIILFETASNEWKQFCNKIQKLLKEYIDASLIGFVKFGDLEKFIVKQCKTELMRYNNNRSYVRKLIRYAALCLKVLLIQLSSDMYLVSLPKVKRLSSKEQNEVFERMGHNCKRSNPLMSAEFKIPPFKPYEPKDGDQLIPKDTCSQEFLDKEIDMSKIVLVDNLEKLEYARTLLTDSKTIGVDLEGTLEKNGMVELVQCAYAGKIFVFDIYVLRVQAQDPHNEKAQTTYNQTLQFLQNMMENPTICKVFHDGRKDSLGLHSCIQSCLLNTFDVSAGYTLISQLEVYSKYQKVMGLDELKVGISPQDIKNNEQLSDEKCEEILKNLEVAARPPGLNDVLETYKASHGLNGLKSIMKERFWTLSRGYFLQRPIDREFLIYSARDVEDLEEVRTKTLKRLEVVLKNICDGPSNETLMLMMSYISHVYTYEGCTELAEVD